MTLRESAQHLTCPAGTGRKEEKVLVGGSWNRYNKLTSRRHGGLIRQTRHLAFLSELFVSEDQGGEQTGATQTAILAKPRSCEERANPGQG